MYGNLIAAKGRILMTTKRRRKRLRPRKPTEAEMLKAIQTRLAVPLLPHAAWALSLGPYAAREAAERGDIPVLPFKGKQKPVPTSALRKLAGLKTA
jgi:hypothetical protein